MDAFTRRRTAATFSSGSEGKVVVFDAEAAAGVEDSGCCCPSLRRCFDERGDPVDGCCEGSAVRIWEPMWTLTPAGSM